MKKILIRIYIVISILLFISLIILSVMGSKKRIGYLGDFYVIENQSYSNNYVYSFKIKYYDKIFRHSDIYGVYLNTNSLPDYVKEIKMNDEFGTPFGTLVSKIKIEDKLDNVKYYLKIKLTIFVLITFMFIISILYIIFYNSKYLNQIMIILLFDLFLLILFNISVSLIHIFIVLLSILVLLVSKKIRYFFSNNELKSRYFKIIFIFLSFLLIPGIVYTSFSFLFDKNNYENRNKSIVPYLIINNLNQYVINYESFFNDYLPFRNELVKLKNIIDINLFKNIMSDKVILGNDNWLFYNSDDIMNNYIGNNLFTEKELEIAKNNLIYLRDSLRKENIDFILMICPYKNNIYNEYMPEYIKVKSSNNSTDRFVKYIRENTDMKIVYPKNELMEYKNKYRLYYKYDLHWNYLGAYIGYMALMRYIGYDLDDINNVSIFKYNSSYGDFFYNGNARLLALSDIKSYNDDDMYFISNYNMSYRTENNYSNIFISGDSFLDYLRYYMSLSKIYEYNHSHIDDFSLEQIKYFKPNLLIFETLESGLKSRILTITNNN